jgi:acetoin utilization deacetylase AcuC-like enzyme
VTVALIKKSLSIKPTTQIGIMEKNHLRGVMDMRTAFISHNDCLKHEMIYGHPEQPERLHAIQDQLVRSGIYDYLLHYEAPLASIEQLARAHDMLYVDEILACRPEADRLIHIDPDTFMNQYTTTAALRAAGAAVMATDLVIRKEVENAFCCVRPPGHHAERRQAMGFCFFNNVAVAAKHALAEYGLERVAVVDFDVHHGNGTEDIFDDDMRVMVCSAYQHPLYPFSGRDTVPGHLINVPKGRGLLSQEFRDAIRTRWLPELEAFKPQMLFISAGFDGHYEDDLAQWNLIESDYAWITRELMQFADHHAESRVVSCLEGGYALSALGRSVTAHIKTLMEG